MLQGWAGGQLLGEQQADVVVMVAAAAGVGLGVVLAAAAASVVGVVCRP